MLMMNQSKPKRKDLNTALQLHCICSFMKLSSNNQRQKIPSLQTVFQENETQEKKTEIWK